MDNVFDELLKNIEEVNTGHIDESILLKWCQENIIVKKYIPVKEKYEIISIIKDRFVEEYINKDETFIKINFDDIYLQYEIVTRLRILFYYTNVTLPTTYINSTIYDMITNSSFYDYVMKLCKTDYERFVNSCDNVININMLNIIYSINSVIESNIEDFSKAVNSLNNLDNEKLIALADINKLNNPFINDKIK
ncbi:MAG: hypothetical protein ACI4SM_00155 [Candidatus Gastranaerophilaceae bacterium]